MLQKKCFQDGLMAKRVQGKSAEEMNNASIPCINNHVGQWERLRNKNRKSKNYWTRFCKQCNLDSIRRNRYGIETVEYERMQRMQNYRCLICKEKKKLCIDHDHQTGNVRGLLCRHCNALVGQYETKRHVWDAVVEFVEG